MKILKLKKMDMLTISLLTFSLFFGAGNLMFPPMLGKEAGTNLLTTMFYFSITAIIFPILAVIAVTRYGGLKKLAERVDSTFALIFTIAAYLAIGPALAIPRAGTLPFEIAVVPYLSEGNMKIGLLVYSFVFFLIVYWFSLSPNKLLDRIGKILSPAFLLLVILLFIGTFIKPLGAYAQPMEKYSVFYGVHGFLDGYMTLDVLAGLNYGLVVAYIIKDKGVNKPEDVENIIVRTGFLSGIFLFIVYMMLAHIGAITGNIFPESQNGIEILSFVSKHIYGKLGFVLLSGMFTIACLNIGIGLITSISQYFQQLIPKISYKIWATFWTVLSFLIANMGLKKIMEYSVPVLLAIYPSGIVLVILSFLDKKIGKSKIVYSMTIYPTLIVSIINTFDKINITVPVFSELTKKLPLYALDLPWVTVSIVSFIIGIIVKILNDRRESI